MSFIFRIVLSILLLYSFTGCSSSSSSDDTTDTNMTDTNTTNIAENNQPDSSQQPEEKTKEEEIPEKPTNTNATDTNTTDTNARDTNATAETNETNRTTKSKYISGVAIDGYLKGASVFLHFAEKEQEIKTKTDSNGFWKIAIDENLSKSNYFVDVVGGIDTSTGLPFEGVISSVVEPSDFVEKTEDAQPVVITPLSTIVTNMVKVGKAKNRDIAEEQIAKLVKVPKEMFRKDILKTANSETEKNISIQFHKAGLAFQKSMEIVANAVQDKNKTEIFSKVTQSIVSEMANLIDENREFSEVLTSSIEKLAKEDTNETNVSQDPIKLALKIALPATKKFVSIVKHSKESNISALSKAIETVTYKIKEKVKSSVAEVLELNTSEETEFNKTIDSMAESGTSVAKAVIAMGGVDRIAGEIEKFDKAIVEKGNVSTFSNMLSDEVVKQYSDIYQIFEEMNISDSNISNIALQVAEKVDSNDTNDSNETNISIVDVLPAELQDLEKNISTLYQKAESSLQAQIKEISESLIEETTTIVENNGSVDSNTSSEMNCSLDGNGSLDGNCSLDTNTSSEINTTTTTTTTTITTPQRIFYMNKWWDIDKYNQLMQIMNEAPPPAMTDESIGATNEPLVPSENTTPTTVVSDSIDETNFATIEDAATTLRDFQELDQPFEISKDLIFNRDFDSVAMLLALMRDFQEPDENLSTLKTLVLLNDANLSEPADLKPIKDLLFSQDFNVRNDDDVNHLTDLIFDYDQVEQSDRFYMTDSNITLATKRDWTFSQDFEQQQDADVVKDGLVFAGDFNQSSNDKDFNQTYSNTRDLVFSTDFEQQQNLDVVKDGLVFAGDFNQSSNDKDFNQTYSDTRDLVFSTDFEKRLNIFYVLKDIAINQSMDFNKSSSDKEFSYDPAQLKEDLKTKLDLAFSLSFANIEDVELFHVKDLVFSNDGDFAERVDNYDRNRDLDLYFDVDMNYKDNLENREMTADINGVLTAKSGKHDIPLMIDYFPNFNTVFSYNDIYDWCRYDIFDYDEKLALDCLDKNLENSLYYQFQRLGYVQ